MKIWKGGIPIGIILVALRACANANNPNHQVHQTEQVHQVPDEVSTYNAGAVRHNAEMERLREAIAKFTDDADRHERAGRALMQMPVNTMADADVYNNRVAELNAESARLVREQARLSAWADRLEVEAAQGEANKKQLQAKGF
jgi:hypothetical protein